MKKFLTYSEFTDLIDAKIPELQAEGFDEVVAVVRGGLTAAHYIAKKLKLPVGVYFPSKPGNGALLFLVEPAPKKILFVEDLVAEGRTYRELEEYMIRFASGIGWEFMPILVDGKYPNDFKYQCLKTEDWIVFPYEEMDKMPEGDRGLFRNGTDSYGEIENG